MPRGGAMPGAGRPKGSKANHTIKTEQARQYIIDQVTANLEEIIAPQIEKAKKGEYQSYKDLVDRAYGKPKETFEGEVTVKGLILDI